MSLSQVWALRALTDHLVEDKEKGGSANLNPFQAQVCALPSCYLPLALPSLFLPSLKEKGGSANLNPFQAQVCTSLVTFPWPPFS